MTKTVQELAEYLNGRLAGDGAVEISGATNLSDAAAQDISFAVEPHLEAARKAKAGALILAEGSGDFAVPAIYVDDPRAAFAKLLNLFTPPIVHEQGVSADAYIGQDVTIGKNVTILAHAYIDDHAVIGDNVTIYPHVYVGQYAAIGDDSLLYSSVTVREHCRVGKRVIIHSSAVIGADGFGFTTKDGVHTKVPQVGNVVIEDDVEIGALVGVDRATTGSTVIGAGTKIDNLVHIAHNCRIGRGNLIVAQTGISGSTSSGDYVTFGGQTGTVGHIHIGGNSVYAARSGINNNMPENYFGAGFPVQPYNDWLRMKATIKHLPEFVKKMKTLEKKIATYEKMFGEKLFGGK